MEVETRDPYSSISAREALICDHLALVEPIARAIGAGLPACFDLDDLIAAGRVGLLRAAESYCLGDHAGVPFYAFAGQWIRGMILSRVRSVRSNSCGRRARRPFSEPPGAREAHPESQDEHAITESKDIARKICALSDAIEAMPAAQMRLLHEFYIAGAPTLRAAAARLGIPPRRADRLYASGVAELWRRFRG